MATSCKRQAWCGSRQNVSRWRVHYYDFVPSGAGSSLEEL